MCVCDTGYHAQGLECVANADPCEGVTCSGFGTCEVVGGQAQCNCQQGYHAQGLECVPDQAGSECVPSATIVCKGELNMLVNGEQYMVRIYAGKTHVWTIRPENRNAYEPISFRYLTNVMTVSISADYRADSQDDYCTKSMASGSIYLNTESVFGQCQVDANDIVFLRITSDQNGDYSFFW